VLEGGTHPGSASDVFDALAAAVEPFQGLTYGQLGLAGRTVAAGAAGGVPA
jgi:hypothetical protein